MDDDARFPESVHLPAGDPGVAPADVADTEYTVQSLDFDQGRALHDAGGSTASSYTTKIDFVARILFGRYTPHDICPPSIAKERVLVEAEGVAADPRTVGALLSWAADRFGRNEAVVAGEQRLTYRELDELVDHTAKGLVAMGVKPGERVSLWLPNSIEWLLTYFAAARIGAVVVPVNTGFRAGEAAYVIGQSGSSTLVVAGNDSGRGFPAMTTALLQDPKVALSRVITVGSDERPDLPVSHVDFADLEKLGAAIDRSGYEDRVNAVDPAAPVIIFYTSGTTGFPKGVVHSHAVLENMRGVAERLRLGPEDVLVLYLPLFHVFASLAGVLTFTLTGGRLVLMPRFDARVSLELMSRERATVVYGMQPIYHDQFEALSPEAHDLSHIRVCVTPAPPDFVRRVDAVMGKAVTVYGMTESTAMTSLSLLDDDLETVATTVGRPLPGFEVQIIDPDTGAVLPANTTGEICVRGDQVMLRYHEKPEETAAVLREDGWLRTGDLGELTPAGYLRFRGRRGDSYRVGGENVDPAEVEAVLAQHPGVGLAAVVGVPDTRLGQIGVAFVQCRPGHSCSTDELRAHVHAKLAGFKVPRRFEFVDEFPRTGSGKIQKYRLTEAADR